LLGLGFECYDLNPQRAMDPELLRRKDGDGHEPSFPVSTAQLLMWLLLGSLTVLFGASIVAFIYTRLANPVWRTSEMPDLPLGLVLCTAFLASLSGCMEWARGQVKKNRFDRLNLALTAALLFALAFLVGQIQNFRHVAAAYNVTGQRTLYAFTFHMLTGLHALHVLGGLIPHLIVLMRARRREYSSSRHEGVRLLIQYWHFLGLVWITLLTALVIFT
jgi:cytochrome c oxidase subunit 3